MFGIFRRAPRVSEAERHAVASQRQLIWWRFKRHSLPILLGGTRRRLRLRQAAHQIAVACSLLTKAT
jgi:hypothetical protein